MKHLVALYLGLLVACTSDGSGPVPADAPAAGQFGATCTTPSDTSTECNSKICTNSFDMLPTPVCSQKCTVSTECPTGASGQKCNMKGYCKP
jgi:hypothetical protein